MSKTASGKFVLRLPSKVHEALRAEAKSASISLNQICVDRLQATGRMGSADWSEALIGFLRHQFRDSFIGLVLFGSYVRGEATEASDWDLMIVLDGLPITRDLYHQWDEGIIDQEKLKRLPLSPHFVSLSEGHQSVGSLWFEVALDGRILYDPHRRVEAKLRSLRLMMAEGRLRRRRIHGHPYWERIDNEV